jgi:hypothetical protein
MYIHIYINVHMYICMYIYVCINVYIYSLYVYIHIRYTGSIEENSKIEKGNILYSNVTLHNFIC